MIALRYLATADSLLREGLAGTAGLWPRACAWLLRLALEAAMGDLWAHKYPAVARTPMRAQLLSLHHIRGLDPQVVARAEYLWVCLSRAGHHHPYELSPTAAELRHWCEDVHMLVLALNQAGGTPMSGDIADLEPGMEADMEGDVEGDREADMEPA